MLKLDHLPHSIQAIGLNMTIALSYFLFGYLGTWLALPPSHVSPIWPASGLALAVALVYGKRILPGLWAGIFAVQLYAFLDFSQPTQLLPTLIMGTLSSLGSSLQAGLGAYLIHRHIGTQNPLIDDKAILKFFIYGGAVSCLMAPTIGISAIFMQGFITLKDLPISWLTWWIGDVIGVIIFTPIILSFIGQPQSQWQIRRKLVAYPLMMVFALVLVIFQYNKTQEFNRIRSAFDQQVSVFHTSFSNAIQHDVEMTQILKGFYDNSTEVSRADFTGFTQLFIEKNRGVQALEWIRYIPQAERDSFERSGITIREPNAKKQMIRATERNDYFPITYVQPEIGNERAIGFDVGTNPDALATLIKARNTGLTKMTKPVQLVQDLQHKFGFVLYSPVYKPDPADHHKPKSQPEIWGFVAGVFRASDEVQRILLKSPHLQMGIKMEDTGIEFFNNFSTLHHNGANLLALQTVIPLHVANRIWNITYQPSDDFYSAQMSWTLWWILLGGFSITALTGISLLMLTGRTLSTEALIKIRTQDLAASEARFHTIFNQAPLGVCVMNAITSRIYDANPAYEKITGRSLDKLQTLDGLQITHPEDRAHYADHLQRICEHKSSGIPLQKRDVRPDGRICWVNVTLAWMEENNINQPLCLCLTEDITERKLSELKEEYRSSALELIASDQPLKDILQLLVFSIEQLNPSLIGSIFVLDEEKKHLKLEAALSLPEFYKKAVNHVAIGEGIGSCGTAAFLGQRVIVSDIQTHPYWTDYKQLAEQAGLASCWSEPIFSTQNEVIGIFAIYHRQTCSPTANDLLMIEQTVALASIAIEKNHANQALKESEQRWQFALEGSRDGVWDWNIETDEVFFSPRYKEILGFKEDEVGNHYEDWNARMHPDDQKRAHHDLERYFNQDSPIYENEHRMRCKDGSYKWVLVRGKVVLWSEDQKPLRMIGTQMDITERKRAEEKLQLSAKVFKETHEGITITDAQAHIIDVNPAFCEITGYRKEEVLGKKPSFLSSGRHSLAFYKHMWDTINEQGYWQGEIWNRSKNGSLYAELLSISSIVDHEGEVSYYIGIFTDITHIKKQQEVLEQMAHYDMLTQLPNRMLLSDRFSQALAHSKRTHTLLAVCFIDLDHFKPVNDMYGHEIGDELLIRVAERIKVNIREEDTASRQGGDEFILLLGDIQSIKQCEQTLKRVIHALAQPYLIEGLTLSIGASIGVSLYPDDDSDLDTLMRHADHAMYQAKSLGRNRYSFFNPEQDQRNIQKNIQLEEIQKALENDELSLYYQPKVNMTTGIVYGAEALIRWIHPKKGLIPPLRFLPVIEATELEIKIGEWVIDQALKQLEIWQAQQIKLEVSVNISSYHLQSTEFVSHLETALNRHPQIKSKYLQLEILESSALSDIQLIGQIIKLCIHSLGVSIALDDFGTGYSSLTHLRNLPCETIKIDQVFVRDLLDDPNDYAIIDSVIGLSESFNREVIAEGVETTQHGLALLAMGCPNAQGYGIARPMPAHELTTWLNQYTPNVEWQAWASKPHTSQENKMDLFRLTFNQWQHRVKSAIQSPHDNPKPWPILKRNQCHCGIWLKRALKDKQFDPQWLKALEQEHDAMHDLTDNLYLNYQNQNITDIEDALNAFEQYIDHFNQLGYS